MSALDPGTMDYCTRVRFLTFSLFSTGRTENQKREFDKQLLTVAKESSCQASDLIENVWAPVVASLNFVFIDSDLIHTDSWMNCVHERSV